MLADERNFRRKKWLQGSFEEAENIVHIVGEVMAARKRLECVKGEHENLPFHARGVFLVQQVDNVKCREIARRFEIDESTVEKHAARAKAFLIKRAKGC